MWRLILSKIVALFINIQMEIKQLEVQLRTRILISSTKRSHLQQPSFHNQIKEVLLLNRLCKIAEAVSKRDPLYNSSKPNFLIKSKAPSLISFKALSQEEEGQTMVGQIKYRIKIL